MVVVKRFLKRRNKVLDKILDLGHVVAVQGIERLLLGQGKLVVAGLALLDAFYIGAHLVHAQTAVVVVGMDLEVSGELLDALGEDSDLNLGRTGVAFVGLVCFDNCGLLVFGDHNDTPFTVFIFPMSK